MIRALDGIAGVKGCHGEQYDRLENALQPLMCRLPSDHLSVLVAANGVSVFDGYFRLFGVGCDECRDLLRWNDFKTWRFAWPSSVTGYVMFGETAWGDQYAYAIDDLADGRESVYLLDAFEMQPEKIAASFNEFFFEEFVRCAREPYDSMLLKAFRRFGVIEWEKQITYIPSPILGGAEASGNIHVLNARSNMIINGDVVTQVTEHPRGTVDGIETYVDGDGRLRTRIVWAEP